MALTDQQFNSYVRFVISALQEMLQEQDQKKKAAKAKELLDNLQAAVADPVPEPRTESKTATDTVKQETQKTQQQAAAADDMTAAFQDWLKNNRTKKFSTAGKSAMMDYGYRVDKVREREKLSWTDLAAKIGEIVQKYDTGGEEMAFGLKNNGANVIALKAFETYVNEARSGAASDNGDGEAPSAEDGAQE